MTVHKSNSNRTNGLLSRGLMVIICLLFFAVVGGIALGRYWRFGQPLGLDNAYFFQRVWQSVFLDEPQRTLLNTEIGQGLIAGRHFEPILILLRPIVSLFPKMEALLLAQVAIISAGGYGAFSLAQRFVRDRHTALILGMAWLLMPGLWVVAVQDFRTLALAAPLVVIAHAAIARGVPLGAAFFTILALACREEVLLLFAVSLPAMWACAKNERREVKISIVCCLMWGVVLLLGHGSGGGFTTPSELLDGASVFVSGGLTQGGPWTRLADNFGGGLVAGVIAPLTLVPLLANALGVVATVELSDVNSVRLYAVAFGAMGLVVAVGFGTLKVLCTRLLPTKIVSSLVRLAALSLLLWNGSTVWSNFQGEIKGALQVVKGDVNPSDYRQNPWELFLSAPMNQPLLTEEAFAPMLAARPELYVSDDWRSDLAFEQVQLHVNTALLRPEHEWVDKLLGVGFVVTRDVGGALLLERSELAPALAPITPR